MDGSSPARESFDRAYAHLPVGVALFTRDLRFVRANPVFCAMLACDEAWLQKRTVFDLLAADAGEVAARVRALLEDPVDSAWRTDRLLRGQDGRIVRSQGTFTFLRGPSGEVEHLICFVVDATAQERVREDLVEARRRQALSEALLDQAFESAPVGMALFDAALRFRRVNAELAAILGYSRDALIGRAWLDLLHPEEQAVGAERMRAAQEGTLVRGDTERRFVDANGRTRWIRVGGTRLHDEGENAYFAAFFDVTERRQAEEERARLQEQVVHAERLRTLGQIVGGIAHEVNNPAAIAVGGADLARRRVATALDAVRAGDLAGVRQQLEQLDRALNYCEDGALRVARVARKFGAFSSLHGGELERLDVRALVERAVELVQNELRHRARVVCALEPTASLVGHPGRLLQAVTNLLVNAGQAIEGPPAEHRITVSTGMEDGEVRVVVEDTGVGIPLDVAARMFDPFFTTRTRDGTGLGLTVVRDVAREHRGRVEVRSEHGRGSRFALFLPVDNGLVALAPSAAAPRARILVADDEPFMAAILGEILATDHDVVTVDSGPAALRALAEPPGFDVVLCDLMMPEVDGIAVHTWLREHAPALAERMIVCTGGAFTARAEAWLADSGVPVLTKPFTVGEVEAAVARALRRS